VESIHDTLNGWDLIQDFSHSLNDMALIQLSLFKIILQLLSPILVNACVMSRSHGYRDVLRHTYIGQKYPHICTLSISTDKNQNTEAQWWYTFQQNNTSTLLSQRVIQYYMNITLPKNAKIWFIKRFTGYKTGRKLTSYKIKSREPGQERLDERVTNDLPLIYYASAAQKNSKGGVHYDSRSRIWTYMFRGCQKSNSTST